MAVCQKIIVVAVVDRIGLKKFSERVRYRFLGEYEI